METETNDVKIDVYFNGTLGGSHYVPRRCSGDAYSTTEHVVRFTGRRIGRLIEKPWVIVPSGLTADGSMREHRRGKVAYAGAQQRWNDISDALMAEADRMGQNESGERPVIGEYLESLAQLSMPKEVEDMQKAGSAKFGVLDVVVIWGKGKKNGPYASYMAEPTPFENGGFTVIDLDQSIEHSPAHIAARTADINTATQSRSEALANAKSTCDHSDTSPLSAPPPLAATPDKTYPATSSPLNKPPFSDLPFETPVKRPRGRYFDILTTKETLSEEIDSIAAAAASDLKAGFNPTFSTNPRVTRASYASILSSSPLSSAPMTRNHTPVQTNTKTVKANLPSPANPARSPSVMNAPRMQDGEGDSKSLTLPRERIVAPGSGQRERAVTQLSAEPPDREFTVPALSADCGITYAPAGIVRGVGAAKGGIFKEGGVIMGARFVVGG